MGILRASLAGVGAVVLAGATSVATAGGASASDNVPSCSQQDGSPTVTCVFSAAGPRVWTVPDGVSQLRVDLYGAQGGDGKDPVTDGSSPGGKGGRTAAAFNVKSGQKFQVTVGGQGGKDGQGGFNGGGASKHAGGGGASDIRTGGSGIFAFENRIAVAGGGGGAGSYESKTEPFFHNGGGDGGKIGSIGSTAIASCGNWGKPLPGLGGSATQGGLGGVQRTFGKGCGFAPDGRLGVGGDSHSYGGGGGGGYFGGGSGGFDVGAYGGSAIGYGGGGGSGYAAPEAEDPRFETGVRSGNGLAVLYFDVEG